MLARSSNFSMPRSGLKLMLPPFPCATNPDGHCVRIIAVRCSHAHFASIRDPYES
jgi:hypothetical protein